MGRRKSDHFSKEAQRRGYPARSVFKLEEIQKRFRPFSSGMSILDVGAAPGSWSLFISDLVGSGGCVTAVDLSPLDARVHERRNIVVIQGDMTDPEIVARLAARGPYSAVVSDAAPATTGNRVVDTARSAALVESVLSSLPYWLASGGAAVCKLFQGGEERTLLARFRERFSSVRMFRPPAVRKESFESYLIAKGYRGGGGGANGNVGPNGDNDATANLGATGSVGAP